MNLNYIYNDNIDNITQFYNDNDNIIKNNLNCLNSYIIEDSNVLELLKTLLNHKNYYHIYDLCYINYEQLSLTLIDNLNNITKNINIDIIVKIYSDYLYYDNINVFKNYQYINYYLIFILVNPIYLLRSNNNIKYPIKLNYNKYISKSIIYINNRKKIIYYLLIMIFYILENNNRKVFYYNNYYNIEKIKTEYNIEKKDINKFLNYYQYFKKDTKITKKLINKYF